MASLQLGLILFIISSTIVSLRAQLYEGHPSRNGFGLQSPLQHSLTLKCRYIGIDQKGQFLDWFKKNDTHDVSVNTDKPGHYVVKTTDQESILDIRIFVEADANVSTWYVKTSKFGFDEVPSQCKFGQITPIASPQGILDDKNEEFDSPHASIRRTEGHLLNLKCIIAPKETDPRKLVEWKFSPDNKDYQDVPAGVVKKGDELQIQSVEKTHRGYYRCSLNKVDYLLLLRVKDRLAALWPFLGIVAIVLALVVVILIYEKRQKSNKKSGPTDDDEQDRASDPLVRTTVKSNDNDNKKRAVKA